jgi:hypothetical protein
MKNIKRVGLALILSLLLVLANLSPAFAVNTISIATLSLTSPSLIQSTGTTSYLGVPVNLKLTNVSTTQKLTLSISQKSYGGSSGTCASGGVSKTTTNFCVFNSGTTLPVAGIFSIITTFSYTDVNGQIQTLTPSLSYSVDLAGNISLISSTPDSKTADQTAPTITLTPSMLAPTNNPVAITEIATDDSTPTDQILFSSDNQLTWNMPATFTATTNGNYTFFAKDLAGNISSSSLQVSNIRPLPTVSLSPISDNPTLISGASTNLADFANSTLSVKILGSSNSPVVSFSPTINGDGSWSIDLANDPSFANFTNGTYSVVATAKNADVLVDSTPQTFTKNIVSVSPIFTASFDSLGGTFIASQSVDSGGIFAKPADPTRDGFTFSGWFSCGNFVPDSSTSADNFAKNCSVYDFSSPATSDINLFSDWIAAPPPVPDPPVLTIAVDLPEIDLSAFNNFREHFHVHVSTNNPSGYLAYITTSELTSAAGNLLTRGDLTSVNEWGFSVSDDNNFAKIPTELESINGLTFSQKSPSLTPTWSPTTAGDDYTFALGANVNSATPAGIYSGEITYSAVANP